MSTAQGSSEADFAAETTCHEEAEINRPSSTTKRLLRKRRPTFSPHQIKHLISKKHTPLTQPPPIPLNTLHDDIRTTKDHFIVHIDNKITQAKNSMQALITENAITLKPRSTNYTQGSLTCSQKIISSVKKISLSRLS